MRQIASMSKQGNCWTKRKPAVIADCLGRRKDAAKTLFFAMHLIDIAMFLLMHVRLGTNKLNFFNISF